MWWRCSTAGIVALALSLPAAALESEWAGNFKGDALATRLPDERGETAPTTVWHGGVRLQWNGFADSWDAEVHYQLDTLWSPASERLKTLEPGAYDRFRVVDLRPGLLPGDPGLQLWQNLDRFNVRWVLPNADLTLGRQAITFGSARLISPSDVLFPRNLHAQQSDFRSGVDAIRIEMPLGELSQADVGYVAGKDFTPELGAAFARLRTNWLGWDWEWTALHFADSYLLGGGAQGAWDEYGLWGEWAYLEGVERHGVRYSLGIDSTWGEDLFWQLEYHHNGLGSDRAAHYDRLYSEPFIRDGLVPFVGRDYLAISASKPLTALLNATAYGTWNLHDDSVMLSGTMEYSLGDETSLSLFGSAGWGDSRVAGQHATEFGNLDAQWQVSVSRYF